MLPEMDKAVYVTMTWGRAGQGFQSSGFIVSMGMDKRRKMLLVGWFMLGRCVSLPCSNMEAVAAYIFHDMKTQFSTLLIYLF